MKQMTRILSGLMFAAVGPVLAFAQNSVFELASKAEEPTSSAAGGAYGPQDIIGRSNSPTKSLIHGSEGNTEETGSESKKGSEGSEGGTGEAGILTPHRDLLRNPAAETGAGSSGSAGSGKSMGNERSGTENSSDTPRLQEETGQRNLKKQERNQR